MRVANPGNDVFKEMSAVRPGEVGFGWEMSPPMECDLRAGEHIGPFLPRIAEMREQTGEAGQSEASGIERGPTAGAAEQPEFEAGEFKRIFGTLNLTGDRLSFKAWSRERLEYGKDALERYLAPHVQHLLDKIEDQVPLMEMAYERAWEEPDEGEGETLPSGIDPEVAGRLEEEHLERHYSTWPDVPLPALDGKTPREAARNKTGRRKINELLKGFENSADRSARTGKPVFDFGRIREELGVPPDE